MKQYNVVICTNLQELKDILEIGLINENAHILLDCNVSLDGVDIYTDKVTRFSVRESKALVIYKLFSCLGKYKKHEILCGFTFFEIRFVAMLLGLNITSYYRCPVTFINRPVYNVLHNIGSISPRLRLLSQYYAQRYIVSNHSSLAQIEKRFGEQSNIIKVKAPHFNRYCSIVNLKQPENIVFLTGAHIYHGDLESQDFQVKLLNKCIESLSAGEKIYVKIHPRDSLENYPFLSPNNSILLESFEDCLSVASDSTFFSNFSYMGLEINSLGGRVNFIVDEKMHEKYGFWFELYNVIPSFNVSDILDRKFLNINNDFFLNVDNV